MLKEDLKKLGRKKIAFIFCLILLGVFLIIGSIGSFQAFSAEDVSLNKLEWKEENSKGKIEDMQEFCEECKEENCDLKLYFEVELPKIDEWNQWLFEREFHCVKIIDGVNYYDKEESYFGVTEGKLESFDYADATKTHEFEVCCGVETYDIAQKFQVLIGTFSEEIFFYQTCKKKEIQPKC